VKTPYNTQQSKRIPIEGSESKDQEVLKDGIEKKKEEEEGDGRGLTERNSTVKFLKTEESNQPHTETIPCFPLRKKAWVRKMNSIVDFVLILLLDLIFFHTQVCLTLILYKFESSMDRNIEEMKCYVCFFSFLSFLNVLIFSKMVLGNSSLLFFLLAKY
jgi:hypothetical protein